MNTKSVLSLGAIGALFLSTASRSTAADESVVGEWFPQATSKGGLGTTRSFESNGTVAISFGAALAFNYQPEPGAFVMTATDGVSIRNNYTVNKDKLTFAAEGAPKQTLTRVKGAEGSDLIGKWTGKHPTGAQQVMEFTPKRNLYFTVPMRQETGTFAIEGDSLTETIQNKQRIWNWKIADGVLTLTDRNGSNTETYKRKE